MMTDIYCTASKVRVWLGEAVEAVELASAMMPWLIEVVSYIRKEAINDIFRDIC